MAVASVVLEGPKGLSLWVVFQVHRPCCPGKKARTIADSSSNSGPETAKRGKAPMRGRMP